MISAAILARLSALKMSAEAMSEVLAILAAVQAEDEDRRAKQRERKARQRAGHSKDGHGTVTGQVCDEDGDTPSLETKAPTPPKTQSLTPNTPPIVPPKKSEAWERFKAAYPKRQGSQRWEAARISFEAAVKAGEDADRIILGASRYAEECRKTGKLGTEFTMQAATWVRQKAWLEYQPPAPETARPLGVFVEYDSPEWRAWRARRNAPMPTTTEAGQVGWYFPTRWPAGEPEIPEFLRRTG